jgi:HEAT repeats
LEAFSGLELLTSMWFPARRTEVVLLSHLVGCSLMVPGFLLLLPPTYRENKWISIPLILGFATPLPIFGPGLVLLFSQYILKLERIQKQETDYFFGDRQYASGTEQSAGNSLTRSLIEHLRSPDIEVRRDAILAARRLDFKSAIPILRMAQQDSDEQVRIFARNTLGQITETLEGSLKAIEGTALSPQQRLDRVMYVAEEFRDYVELGLIAEGSKKSHLEKVITLLLQSSAAEPENEKILCLLLKFCILARDIDQAKIHLLALKKLAPTPDVTLPWELELYFEERDWQRLSEMLTTIQRSHSQDPHLMKVYNFWHQKAYPAA